VRQTSVLLTVLVVALGGPPVAAAHGGGAPSLVVPVDHVDPGASFPVIAADFGSDAVVSFRIELPGRSAALGLVTAGPDGHFSASLELPADYPVGWANLIGSGDDGSLASTQLLVGPVTEATPPRPRSAAWWQDPAALLLFGLLGGGALLLIWVALRSRRAPRQAGRR
jgi:hypothetical protein